jgi:hypothetical protein
VGKYLGKDSHLLESQTPTLIKNIVDILDTVPNILLHDSSTPNLDASELRGYFEVISSTKKVQNFFKGCQINWVAKANSLNNRHPI